MAREIARRIDRFDVRVVAPAQPGDHEVDSKIGASVHRVKALGFGSKGTYAAVNIAAYREAKSWKPDVALAMHTLAAPGLLATRIPTAVCTYAVELLSPRIRRVAGRVLPRAERVIAVSNFSARASIACGARNDRVAVIPTGAPEPRDLTAPAVHGFRERYGLGGDPVILTVARLLPHKGIDRVIACLPSLPEVRYLVVGDGPARGELERAAALLGVSDRVTFTGPLADDDMPLAYGSADIFALLSRDTGGQGVEGCPVALLEASAYGLPIVAGRTGGIADAVEDDVTGLLVDPENMAEAIGALSSVLNQPDLAKRLGNLAKVRATTERSWAAVVERFEDELEGIVRRAAR